MRLETTLSEEFRSGSTFGGVFAVEDGCVFTAFELGAAGPDAPRRQG